MWLTILTSALMGSILIQYGMWYQRRKDRNRLQFKWSCLEKNCNFHVESNYMEGLMKVADNHVAQHKDRDG